jgi:hypothetical protein
MQTSAQETLVVPGWENLKRRLDRARRFLWNADETGCMEGLFGLDIFRAAVDPELPPRDRAYIIMCAMGWMSFYLAGNDKLSDDMRSRAGEVNCAIGNLIPPVARLMRIFRDKNTTQ